MPRYAPAGISSGKYRSPNSRCRAGSQITARQQPQRHARTVREILHGGGREAAAEEECRDLAVLQGSGRLGCAQPLPRHVTIGIESGGSQDANRNDFRAASRRARRHGLAAQIGHRGNTGRGGGHDVRVVGVEDGETCRWHGTPLECAAAGDGIGKGVGQHECEVRAAVAKQLEIVDRRGRDFRRRADARQVLVEDFGEAAAVRVVHASRTAGRNREKSCARLAAVRTARAEEQDGNHDCARRGRSHWG